MRWQAALITVLLLFICFVIGMLCGEKPRSNRFTKENDNHFHCTGTRIPK